MGNLFLWILVFLFLSLMDIPKMWRKNDKYEIWAFGILLLSGVAYGILFDFNVNLPDPKSLEQMIFEPIGKKIMLPNH